MLTLFAASGRPAGAGGLVQFGESYISLCSPTNKAGEGRLMGSAVKNSSNQSIFLTGIRLDNARNLTLVRSAFTPFENDQSLVSAYDGTMQGAETLTLAPDQWVQLEVVLKNNDVSEPGTAASLIVEGRDKRGRAIEVSVCAGHVIPPAAALAVTNQQARRQTLATS
ncbi:hypothetical protein G7085_00310 [Tessaracoccus sp. HDW20]|uniref:hypothetical protein n=1 Tax=Tessaracoccus coleopterorum TaxID=2714950 RepID=UPI0018D3B710|nr:hypothetical protein [Tessaracoccus coleopterorum]NHB83665.1 hypothetical protein [Tessaracoccus coleopterorum]